MATALEFLLNTGSQHTVREMLWAPYYEAILNILGSTGVIVPLGDTLHGGFGSTITTVGEEQLVFTASEAIRSFDTSFSYQGAVPIITFNGTDEELDTPDDDYWSRGNGSSDFAFSVGGWIQTNSLVANQIILAKFDSTSGSEVREWQFRLENNGTVKLELFDESTDGSIDKITDAAITTAWTNIIATYDGGSAGAGITMYVDGSSVAATANLTGSYTAMENLGSTVQVSHVTGSGGTSTNFFDGSIVGGPLGPFYTQKELSADEVLRLYNIGRRILFL